MADYTEKLANLLSYAPSYYRESGLYRSLMVAGADEVQCHRDALEDIFRQFFVETATWGLGYWEAELGLVTNESLSPQARRAAVLQKLRGTGTLTAQKLANILASYGPRAALIEENISSYHFNAVLVDFLQSVSRPMEDQGAAIRDTVAAVRPAHLAFTVRYQEYLAEALRKALETGRTEVTSGNYEPAYGHNPAGTFLLGTSALGLNGGRTGPEWYNKDEGRTEVTLGKNNEAVPSRVETHLTHITRTNAETAPRAAEATPGHTFTLSTYEFPAGFAEENGLLLGRTVLNRYRPYPARHSDAGRAYLYRLAGGQETVVQELSLGDGLPPGEKAPLLYDDCTSTVSMVPFYGTLTRDLGQLLATPDPVNKYAEGRISLNLGRADHRVTALVEQGTATWPGLAVRMTTNVSDPHYVVRYAGGKWEFWRGALGAWTNWAAVVAGDPGVKYLLTVQAVGNTVAVYVDGVKVAESTDTQTLTGTYVGYHVYNGTMLFNNLRAETM